MRKAEGSDRSLADAPEAVFRIWHGRWRVEIEAAGIFEKLADDLILLRGAGDPVAGMARAASEDEYRHANFCQAILGHGVTKYSEPAASEAPAVLGPRDLSLEDRVLYACVSVGCVTETLSTALLIEMYKRARPGIIKETIHQVLEDEVSHSRIGWAELARAAASRDTRWLSAHVPRMIQAAVESDVRPMLSRNEAAEDLSSWGVLSPSEAKALITGAIESVIVPGLAQYGISTTS